MSNILTTKILETMGTRYGVLGINGYSLTVRFRICGSIVECSVPIWSGISDLPDKIEEVTLVVIKNSGTDLSWTFLRGSGKIIKNQDWVGLAPSEHSLVDLGDLYHLLRIEPKRMELFDETKGWGFRETVDFIIPSVTSKSEDK